HLVRSGEGGSQGRVGAMWHEAVIDLAGGAKDLAVQRNEPARGRGFPKTMLELVEGGEAPLARAGEAFEAGAGRGGQSRRRWPGRAKRSRRVSDWSRRRAATISPRPASPIRSPRCGCSRR